MSDAPVTRPTARQRIAELNAQWRERAGLPPLPDPGCRKTTVQGSRAFLSGPLRTFRDVADRNLVYGYTVWELVRHIERQFHPGMTWENYGEWHIDHVIPLSLFVFDSADHPGFKAAWALANLRPLWAEDNLKKRAKRTHLL